MKYNLDEFKCTLCGKCCEWEGYVAITELDAEKISMHLELTLEEFLEQYTEVSENRKHLILKEPMDGTCLFYHRESKRCQIYTARPQQCRDFPWKWQHDGCPGLQECLK